MSQAQARIRTDRPSIQLRLHPKQSVAYTSAATEILYGGAVAGGKLLPLTTPIPTRYGWVPMGDLRVGSEVFDETGSVCQVTGLSEIEPEPELYRLSFDDKTDIDCCADHQWLTYSYGELAALTRLDDEWRARRRAKRPSRAKGNKSALFTLRIRARNAACPPPTQPPPTGTVRTTREIAATLRTNRGHLNHAIPVAGCLDLPDAILPIDPYVLGAWLGDGDTKTAHFTGIDPEIWEEIERRGYDVSHHASGKSHQIRGLGVPLRNAGLLGNKHIPHYYLRASKWQRLDLLRGLMDTDGTVARASGSAEFTNTNERIIDGVIELIHSLGWKVTKRPGVAKLDGRVIGPKWTLKWTPSEYVFLLPRKRDLQKLATSRTARFRYITNAERIPSVPGRCIQVDSPRHLYLAGQQMIPTHNSHLMRVAAISWCMQIPGLQCYLFRRLRDDLVKNHMEGPKGLRALLSPWVDAGVVSIVQDEIRFQNGSKIFLCHCKEETDRYKYLGSEIHLLLIDELTTFTETIYRFLRSRVRMVGIQMPPELKGRFPRILCSSNPGNIGHHFVRAAFIDPQPPLEIWQTPPSEGGMLRQYIPARLADNPSMTTDDPTYAQKLEGLGSPELVRALRDGDWDVVAGAFFTEWNTAQHVVRPFPVPPSWLRFRSFDWGSARPFVVQWFAVSDGSHPGIPADALVLYREWYGGTANVGLKLTAEQVADGIKLREAGDEPVTYSVADPSIFSADGGPSLAERFALRRVYFKRADNKRFGTNGHAAGWDLVRQRLVGDDNVPMLYVFDTARDLIRSLPTLQHSEARPEDLETNNTDDHCADACFVAGTMIATRSGHVPIERIRVGDEVMTRAGYCEVTAVFSNGVRPVKRVGLSNGQALTGTGNHPIFVPGCGFIPLDALRYGDTLWVCPRQLSAATFRCSSISAIQTMATIFKRAVGDCTAWCGSIITGLSRQVSTSIISTRIVQITGLRTLCLCPGQRIGPIIFERTHGLHLASKPAQPRRNGMVQKQVSPGTRNIGTDTAQQRCSVVTIAPVSSAGSRLLDWWDVRGSAPTPARRLGDVLRGLMTWTARALRAARRSGSTATVDNDFAHDSVAVAMEPQPSGVARVYNLSVAGREEYFANGVLVHNCRYACASRPWQKAPPPATPSHVTMEQLWNQRERELGRW